MRIKKYFPLLLSLMLPIVLFIHNLISAIKQEKVSNFFEAPLYTIINIFIAIFFAYFMTQYKNDTRRKKEIVESIVNKLLADFCDKRMYCITCESDITHIRITQRSIANRINLLKEYEKEFKIADDIKYISDNYQLYWDTISNHITDLEHLKKSENDLLNIVTKAKNRLEKIIVYLYK